MTAFISSFTPKPMPNRSDANASIIDMNFSLLGAAVRSLSQSSSIKASPSSLPGGFGGFSNPSASVGLTAINGISNTAMRSDSAPPINQGITPTWTATHTFTLKPILSSLTASQAVFSDGSKGLVSNPITGTGNVVMSASPTLTGTLTAAKGLFTSDFTLGASTLLAGSALVYNAGTGDMTLSPTTFTLATAASLSSTLSVTGTVGIGVASVAWNSLRISTTNLTTTDQYGVVAFPTFTSSATSSGTPVYAQLKTAASSFTMTNGYGVHIDTPSKGSGSTITNLYGIYIENQAVGGTSNFSLYTNQGLVRFGDSVRIGSDPGADFLFAINPTSVQNSHTSMYGQLIQFSGASGHTSQLIGCSVTMTGAFNTSTTDVIGIQIGPGASSGSGVFTNNYGLLIGDVSSGTNRYAIKTGLGKVSFGDNLSVSKNVSGFTYAQIYNSNNTASSVSLLELTAGGTSAAYAGVQFDVSGGSNGFLMALVPSTASLGCQTLANGVAWYAYQGSTSGYANLSLCGFSSSFNSGNGIVFVADRANAPTGNPSGGGYFYSEAGALKWRGSSGTITTIAPA